MGSGTYSAVLINDEAVGTDLGKKFVLVMDGDKPAYRSVELGPKIEGLRIVRSGLNKDDTIIVKGLQRVRPGSPVAPETIPMASKETLAALAQQRQALEAGNLEQVAPEKPAPKLASVATPRGSGIRLKMNFSKFFISRPIFAAVLSLLILIAGAISLFQLPISEYPEVVPPTVVVRANFPGANPKVIGETVAAPLEQAITGVENMLYMSSQSTADDGKLTLTITFALGTDLDNAQVQVQNRVTRTQPKLPEEVTRIGITVDKASPDLTMVVHLTSPDQRYDMLYLSNYALLNIKDELARLGGRG